MALYHETRSAVGCAAADCADHALEYDRTSDGRAHTSDCVRPEAVLAPRGGEAAPKVQCSRCGVIGIVHATADGCISELRDALAEATGGEVRGRKAPRSVPSATQEGK